MTLSGKNGLLYPILYEISLIAFQSFVKKINHFDPADTNCIIPRAISIADRNDRHTIPLRIIHSGDRKSTITVAHVRLNTTDAGRWLDARNTESGALGIDGEEFIFVLSGKYLQSREEQTVCGHESLLAGFIPDPNPVWMCRAKHLHEFVLSHGQIFTEGS